MAGMIESMFPEFSANLRKYFEEGGSLVEKPTQAIARGVQQGALGAFDLNEMVWGLAGVDTSGFPLTSNWADKKGYLVPMPKAKGPLGQLGLDTLNVGASMLTPTGVGDALSRAITQAPIPAGEFANPNIYSNTAQRSGEATALDKAAKIRSNKKFASQVQEFDLDSNNQAGKVFDNFKRSISRTSANATILGENIQKTFRTWFDNVTKTYKDRNNLNYEAAVKVPAASLPIPTSRRAMAIANDFINENMTSNTPPEFRAAMMDMQRRVNDAVMLEGTLKGLHQTRQEANRTYRVEFMDQDTPFKKADPGSLKGVEAVYKKALDARLEDAVNVGGDVGDAAKELQRANEIFERTTNKLKSLQEEAINKFIGNKDGEKLSPEVIYNRVLKATPKERKFFTSVADSIDPTLTQQVRRAVYDDLYNSGVVTKAGTNLPDFNVATFVDKANKLKRDNPELLDWVLGKDPAVKEQFNSLLKEADMAATKSLQAMSEIDPTNREAANAVAGIVSGAAQSSGAGRFAYAAVDAVLNKFRNKEELFKEMFTPGYKAAKEEGKKAEIDNYSREGMGLGVAAEIGREGTQSPPSDPVVVPTPPEPQQQPVGPVSAPADDFTVELTPEERALRAKQKGANAGEQVMAGKVAAPLAPYDDNSIEAEFAREKARVQSVMRELQMLKPGDPRRAILEKELE